MKRYRVDITLTAESQLAEIENYIASEASREIARRFVLGLLRRCHSLASFALRGTPRDDLRPGLRSIPYRRSATIFYSVNHDIVTVIGIFHKGRDLENALRDPIN